MDALRELRRRKGWNQRELAKHAGVGQDTISGIEAGRHEPRPSTLKKLADALGVEIPELYGEPAPRPKEIAPLSLEWALTAPRDALEAALSEASLPELGSLAPELTRYVKNMDRSAPEYPDVRRRAILVAGEWGIRARLQDPGAETPRSGGRQPAPERVSGEESQAG